MKRIKILTAVFALGMLAVSCSDFLDVKPIGKMIPSRVSELEFLMNNPNTLDYHFMDNNRTNYYAMLGDNLELSENQANNLYAAGTVNLDLYAAYVYYKPFTDPIGLDYTWEWGIYRAVSLFNNVIEGVESLSAGERDSELGKQVMAQAKAGRAWSYMTGAVGYGPLPGTPGSNTEKILPYRTSAMPLQANPDLSTTDEIFAKVKEDLDAAIAVPSQVPNPSRAGKAAVEGLFALYYMYQGKYAEMLEEADKAITTALGQNSNSWDNLIYDFNDFSYIPGIPGEGGVDDEVGWDLQHSSGDETFKQTSNRENLFFRKTPAGNSNGTSSRFYPSAEFVSLFDTEKDMRYVLFMLTNKGYVGDGLRVFNYRASKTNINQGITYPELLLMRAEGYARAGRNAEALADLNTLRQYRYKRQEGDPVNINNLTGLTGDALIVEILKERRREMPIGSFQRIVDLKRFAAFDAGKPWAKASITHTMGSQVYTANVSEFVLPISNRIINYNPQWGLSTNDTPWKPKG